MNYALHLAYSYYEYYMGLCHTSFVDHSEQARMCETRMSLHGLSHHKREITLFIFLFALFCHGSTTGLERLDLILYVGLALFQSKAGRRIYLAFGPPVLRLVCWFESGVLPNGCVSIGINFFDVL